MRAAGQLSSNCAFSLSPTRYFCAFNRGMRRVVSSDLLREEYRMKKNQFDRWWWALRAPDTQGLTGVLLFFLALFLAVAAYMNFHPFPLGLAILVMVCYALLVRSGLRQYDVMGKNWAEQQLRERAQQWALSADSPDEVWQRQHSISQFGAAGAMSAAGAFDWAPPVNVDGSPMIAGTGTDIYGNTYGSADLTPDFSSSGEDPSPGFDYSASSDAGTSWSSDGLSTTDTGMNFSESNRI
jgi:hypothetical protein